LSDRPQTLPRRVLIVDDQPFIRTTVRQLLSQLGIVETEEAGDGGEALEKCDIHNFDLIFLDVEMEPMNGEEFLRALRAKKSPDLSEVPVVMLTNRADENMVRRLVDIGVNGYIVKPPSFASVKSSIERACAPSQ
jgi:two-component system chemotaxis response regulator CheY